MPMPYGFGEKAAKPDFGLTKAKVKCAICGTIDNSDHVCKTLNKQLIIKLIDDSKEYIHKLALDLTMYIDLVHNGLYLIEKISDTHYDIYCIGENTLSDKQLVDRSAEFSAFMNGWVAGNRHP